MVMEQLFRSVLEMDRAAIVLCDLQDTIVYMNPAAEVNYARYGGKDLLGRNLLDCHNSNSREMIHKIVAWFAEDKTHNMIHTDFNHKKNRDVYMVALRDDNGKLIGYYEKHEFRTKEPAPCYDFSKSLI